MSARPTHVLVIEDDPDINDLLRMELEAAGLRVTTAPDGAAGLSAARSVTPDVVLLDVLMPILDGWQTLEALKSSPETADVPVIMLTAMSTEIDVIRGTLNGAVEYLTKPFVVAEVLATVRSAATPPDEAERARRRTRTVELLQRLAELDSGREAAGVGVRWSRLEAPPSADLEPGPAPIEADRLDTLTRKQRYVAEQLARGRSARELATELEVSRSNVYATRKRIGRKLGVAAEDVEATARQLGLAETNLGRPSSAD